MHLNRDFRRHGAINPDGILLKEDVSNETSAMLNEVEPNADRIFSMLNCSNPPDVNLLQDCRSISGCDLSHHCWSFLPKHHVGELYYGGKKKWQLLEQEINSLVGIPSSFPLSFKQ